MMQKTLSLSEARRRLNLTQPALAEELGVDIATIWRWENRGVPTRGAAKQVVENIIARAARLPARDAGAVT